MAAHWSRSAHSTTRASWHFRAASGGPRRSPRRTATGRKAFEKLVKPVLPASHRELARAIEREARVYRDRIAELDQRAVEPPQAEPAEEAPAGDAGDLVVDDELEEQPA